MNRADYTAQKAAPVAFTYKEGQQGLLEGFSSDYVAGKLIAMGVLPGAAIQVLRRAPLGGGWYVRIGTQNLALRKDELESIIMKEA